MEGELVANFFLFQKLKEILTPSKLVDFQNLKGAAQKLSPPRPESVKESNKSPDIPFLDNSGKHQLLSVGHREKISFKNESHTGLN